MLPKIMIVEDDDVIREIYALKFDLEGFPVDVAENGQIALQKVYEFSPDVILLDMMMPVMGGLDFMKLYLAEKDKHKLADIIVFSNISAPQQMNEVLTLGAVDYWVKSDYTPDQVVRVVGDRFKKQAAA